LKIVMRKKIILTITFVLCSLMPYAQVHNISKCINSSDGLSNNFVNAIAIDGQGYVWAATESGVNRIAGKICQPVVTSEIVSGQYISSLYWHEPSGQMLIGTERGLAVYNPTKGTTEILNAHNGLVKSSINNIASASDGVWLVYGNGEVQKLKIEKGKLLPVNLKMKELHDNRCAIEDGRGHLYIGHPQHGMSIVDLSTGQTTNYRYQKEKKDGLPGNNVRCIYKDRQQRIWVGTDRGLARFDPNTGTFSKVSGANGFEDNVYDIKQMNDGTLWIATDIGGIKVLSPDNAVLCYENVSVKTSSLNTRSVLQDPYGNVWIGNHSTGIDFISAQKSDFNILDGKHSINAMANDTKSDGLWIANENGLSLWHDLKMTRQWSGQNKMHREFSYPRCMMTDRNGNVWIGIDDQGVFRFDRKTELFEHIRILPEGSDIHSFYEDADGNIWIGAEYGAYKYHDGKIVKHEAISKMLHSPITCILKTSNNQVFIATLGDGIYSFNLKTNKHKHLTTPNGFPTNKIRQVIKDRKNSGLWLATDAGLIHLADPVNLKGISCYGRQQGLNDIHLQALQQSGDGDIWLSTYSGLSRFDHDSKRFYNFGVQDTHQPTGFASGAAITSNDGTIYFGSASGACFFNPKLLNRNSQVSDVQIIDFGFYASEGKNTILQQLMPDSQKRVYTEYNQNTIRLTFTVRDFAQAESVEYSYMMKGMDNKWYNIENDHDVIFRGLQPGHYTFILRAKLKNQDWENAKQTQLEIIINPPFWRTWWAYIIYAIALMLWIVWLMRSYKRRLTLRNSLELEKRESQQKQELNEERLRFFTNITHELRTPLTLILGPLEDLADDKQLPQTCRRRVSMIQKSADRLRELINEILEFRKAETQNRRLTVAKGDLGKFVREIGLYYNELNRNPKVKFELNIDENLPNIYFDSEIITTVLNNLLSNAIKYTEEGSISTTVSMADDRMVSISVADTGYGISPEALPHVFERYYQANDGHQASGTGIGLALVKSLADLHEAQLSVESTEGRGSRFTLSLSIDNTYPNALHKDDEPVQSDSEDEMQDSELEAQGESMPTLLVVEDNADIRQYIADSFCDDFRIIEATNGEEGVQMAQEQIPDIIVSDIMMPKMNGIQLTRVLKGDIRTSHIPIILLTAKDSDEDKEDGYDSGADSYITKPFTAKLLASRIKNLLTARRRLAEYISNRSIEPEKVVEEPMQTINVAQLSRLDQEFLDKLNDIITGNIMNQDIDLPFVTDKMAMSHSTFYRKVKALTGMTAKEYIRKFRLQHCYKLLESGDYNVTEAAMMTGFNQMSHFRETFKKEFGILPSEVKKKNS